jgi:hypothetical protein
MEWFITYLEGLLSYELLAIPAAVMCVCNALSQTTAIFLITPPDMLRHYSSKPMLFSGWSTEYTELKPLLSGVHSVIRVKSIEIDTIE